MIKIVSWNIGERTEPWRELNAIARNGEADVALLQDAGRPPDYLAHLVEYDDKVLWNRASL